MITRAWVIFLLTYAVISIRRLPWIRIDRPAGALVGAVAMVLAGVISLHEAYSAIDMDTIVLLLGMMVLIAYLRLSGFFDLVARKILRIAHTPLQLLILVVFAAGILSALFVNDTICLIFTPILVSVIRMLGLPPMPYLLALATASNIGSAMTVTGNPQNMYIGIQSGISYLSFLRYLMPVTIVCLFLNVLVVYAVYRRRLQMHVLPTLSPQASVLNRPLFVKSLGVGGLVVIGFSLGMPYPLAAITGAALLLVLARSQPQEVFREVDWTLLLFFCGLFVVMHGVEKAGVADLLLHRASIVFQEPGGGQILGVSIVSLILSNLVSNVPAVMLLRPLAVSATNPRSVWLTLAMSSTFAGNLTLIGSVANLIVAQQAERWTQGIGDQELFVIGFGEYLKVGVPLTLLSTLVGVFLLTWTVADS